MGFFLYMPRILKFKNIQYISKHIMDIYGVKHTMIF